MQEFVNFLEDTYSVGDLMVLARRMNKISLYSKNDLVVMENGKYYNNGVELEDAKSFIMEKMHLDDYDFYQSMRDCGLFDVSAFTEYRKAVR